MTTKFLSEIFFWFHFSLMPILVISAFFVPFWIFLAALFLYWLSLKLFKGCAVTIVQRKHGLIPQGINFTQWWMDRLFGQKITVSQSKTVVSVIVYGAIVIALIRAV